MKIPQGAVSIFPGISSLLVCWLISLLLVLQSSSIKPNHFLPTDNSLFSSGNDSDSVESKANGAPATKTPSTSKQLPGGGGLFDDEYDDDDDFFSGKSLNKSDSGKCMRIECFCASLQVQIGFSP